MLMQAPSLQTAVRLFFGVLVLAAVAIQAIYLVQHDAFNPFNYFGYFTNLSNVFAGVLLTAGALYVGRRRPAPVYDAVRGAITLYMVATGLIYAVLLSGEDLGLLLPWVNIVLHVIMPLVLLADWLLWPPRNPLRSRHLMLWMVWPLVYLIYTLIRGAAVHWYPYPFLNPEKVDGYIGVALYCLGVTAAFLLLGWLIIRLGASKRRS